MKAKDIREMTDEELDLAFRESSQDLFNMKLQQALGQLENPARIRLVRRDVARIETEKSRRRLNAAVSAAPEKVKEEA